MKILLPLILLAAASIGNCAEQQIPAAPNAAFIGLVQAFSADKAKNIWPGYNLLADPLLLYFAGTGQSFLIGHPNPPPAFSPVSGENLVYFSTSYPRQIGGHFETLRPLNSMKTNTFTIPRGYNPQEELGFIAHEIFHTYQKKAFKPQASSYCEVSPEVLALMYMENYAAAKMLLAPDKAAPAMDFLALRKRKYKLAPDCRKEDLREISEGTAKYVEVKSFGAPGAAASAYGALNTIANSGYDPDGARHARSYQTGAALCLALENRHAGWRKEVEEGRAPSELLDEKIGHSSDLKEVYRKYDYDSFLRSARAALDASAHNSEELFKEINNYKGIRLRLIPAKEEISTSYAALSTKRAAKYTLLELQTLSLTGSCEKLSARNMRLLEDGKTGPILMTGNSLPEIILDGKSTVVSKRLHVNAARASIRGDNFTLEITCPAEINIENKEITVEIKNNGR